MTTTLPPYDDLPRDGDGIPSAWGLFGEHSSLGAMGTQTAERVRAAAHLIKRGTVFTLDAPLDAIDPPMFGRETPRRSATVDLDGLGVDDHIDGLFTHGSSHWDALGHIAFAADRFFDGASLHEVVDGRRNTIEHWAQMGIAGRAVLLDLDALLGGAGVGFNPGSARAVAVGELEACRSACGVQFQPADVLLLHTGYLEWYLCQPRAVRERCADEDRAEAVGLAHEEAVVRYLWDAGVRAVASDCPALEVWPPNWRAEAWPFGFLHQMLLGRLGIAIGELWALGDLARDCRSDRCYEMFLTSAPMNFPGAIGSPPHAIAIK